MPPIPLPGALGYGARSATILKNECGRIGRRSRATEASGRTMKATTKLPAYADTAEEPRCTLVTEDQADPIRRCERQPVSPGSRF